MQENEKVSPPESKQERTSVSKKQMTITDSPHIREIDALLLSGEGLGFVQKTIKEKFGEDYGRATFQRRREKVLTAKNTAMTKLEKADAKQEAHQKTIAEQMHYELTSMGEACRKIAGLVLKPDDPMYKEVTNFQAGIKDIFRTAAELFFEFDHLAGMRYCQNAQHMRVARGLKLEAQMGLNIRDTRDDIELFSNLIDKSLELHQSLGLKPKFGDPQMNITVNVGGQPGNTETYGERERRLRAFAESIKDLSLEERSAKIRESMGWSPYPVTDAKEVDDTAKPKMDK
jgi:hypothetical protein